MRYDAYIANAINMCFNLFCNKILFFSYIVKNYAVSKIYSEIKIHNT